MYDPSPWSYLGGLLLWAAIGGGLWALYRGLCALVWHWRYGRD